MDRLNLLKSLSEVNGIPGFEGNGADASQFVENVRVSTDNLGNLLPGRQVQKRAKCVPALMDEIGFMVHHHR